MGDETTLIKERLDLADVIAEYMTLQRVGNHFKGLCPFHQEKTPSFVVSPEKGIWHCFGCGEGGDIFTFVQRLEGLDFPETLKMLAERAGVPLSSRVQSQSNARTRLYELLEVAARFYHEILVNQAAGQKARDYLTKRGVTPATLELFHVGYAPHQWDTLHRFLARKGFTDAELLLAGLVGKNQQGKIYDRFRGRIMFPIHDIQGRVVAFGGRIVPWHATGNEGKYVNSPETPVYEKRNTIYNLHRAKAAIRSLQVGIVVEGYMDVVMLVQSGIEHVVASSGTAFTTEQIAQLKRFTSTLHFAFDADSAGLHAGIAATHAAISQGVRVATIAFPAGQDPADVAASDPKKIQEYIAHSQSLMRVLLQQLSASSTATEKEDMLRELLPLVKSGSNIVQQGEMIQELSSVLHVPEETIRQELAKTPAIVSATSATTSTTTNVPTTYTPEHRLVGLLLLEPSVRAALLPQVSEELFIDPAATRLLHELTTAQGSHPDFDTWTTAQVMGIVSESSKSLAEATALLSQAERAVSSDTPEHEGQQLVRYLKRRSLERKLLALQQRLINGGTGEQQAALQEFQAVAQELAQVQSQQ
ncbi:MAG: DNA primase [Candidatus Andersenbacteria bacterium]